MTGEYAFLFDLGTSPSDFSFTLSQRGDIPVGAIALDMQVALPGARVEVRLDGTLVYEKDLLEPARIKATRIPALDGVPERVKLQFAAVVGRDYFVEFRDSLGPESSWQTLSDAPHNSGTVTDNAANPQRFYRVRSVPNGS
jgi:hypothetical protein